jgi:diguanylate cyclase (GGDEF)-like protein
LEHRIDSSRADRQRFQMNALANITRVMSESEDLETVLNSIGGTIAAVTGIDYVSIDIVDSDGVVKLRCVNSLHPRLEERRGKWTRGGSRPDPVRDEVLKTRRPMLFTDAQNDERIPESGRNFFVRILIRSAATFPLLAKEEVLGTLSFASHRPLGFGASEVELLEGLTAQVASAIKGIQLYQELEESREQLEQSMGIEHHLARTDSLTGIPNRRFLDETVETECARARRYGQPLSVIMVDVDHLKGVNDGWGHAAGDDALRYVAQLARETCREVDVVGRCGGDEFLFVLPSTGAREATSIAERFRRRLAESPIATDGEPVHVTVSLGVAEWDSETMEEPTALIRQADRVMYMAKAIGRNRTMVADGKSARAA